MDVDLDDMDVDLDDAPQIDEEELLGLDVGKVEDLIKFMKKPKMQQAQANTIKKFEQNPKKSYEEIMNKLSPHLRYLSTFDMLKNTLLTLINTLKKSKRSYEYYEEMARESTDNWKTSESLITAKYRFHNDEDIIDFSDKDLIEKVSKIIKITRHENIKLEKELVFKWNAATSKLSFIVGHRWPQKAEQQKYGFEKFYEKNEHSQWLNNLKETKENSSIIIASTTQATLLQLQYTIKLEKPFKVMEQNKINTQQLVSMVNIDHVVIPENNEYEFESDYYFFNDYNKDMEKKNEREQLKYSLGLLNDEMLKQYQIKKIILRVKRSNTMKLFADTFMDELEKEIGMIEMPHNIKILIQTLYDKMYHNFVFKWEVDKIFWEEALYEIFNDDD